MNLCLYASISRDRPGAGRDLEFIGPLAVATPLVAPSSRRAPVPCSPEPARVLTAPGPVDGCPRHRAGAGGRGCVGRLHPAQPHCRAAPSRTARHRGGRLVTAVAWIPVAIWWFWNHPRTWSAIGLAVLCGLLSSVAPYAADVVTLRRVPTHLFSTLSSVHPVWAALAGWVVLDQVLVIASGWVRAHRGGQRGRLGGACGPTALLEAAESARGIEPGWDPPGRPRSAAGAVPGDERGEAPGLGLRVARRRPAGSP